MYVCFMSSTLRLRSRLGVVFAVTAQKSSFFANISQGTLLIVWEIFFNFFFIVNILQGHGLHDDITLCNFSQKRLLLILQRILSI